MLRSLFALSGALLCLANENSLLAKHSNVEKVKDNLIVKPLDHPEHFRRMMVIVNPDKGVSGWQYIEHMLLWQDQASELGIALSVGIIDYLLDIPNPIGFEPRILIVREILKAFSCGLTCEEGKDVFTFFAGHATGAGLNENSMLRLYEKGWFSGQILMGAYLERKFFPPISSKFDYSLPTLTIGAELHYKSARVSRMAEALFRQLNFQETHPVIVIEGMNQMQFATDNGQADFTPEFCQEKAQQKVATVASSFMAMITKLASATIAKKNFRAYFANSTKLLSPLIAAYQFEGSGNFDMIDQIGVPNSDCPRGICKDTYSSWALFAQQKILGDDVSRKFHFQSNYANLAPLGALPFTRDDRIPFVKDGVIQTYTQSSNNDVLAYRLDLMYPTSSEYIYAQMLTKQKIFQSLGQEISDDPDYCRILNEEAYNWALENAPDSVKDRFMKHGQKLKFVESSTSSVQSFWFYEHGIKYHELNDGSYEVESLVFKPKSSFFGLNNKYDGVFYCKLYSPARAMEWIYVDSLLNSLYTSPMERTTPFKY